MVNNSQVVANHIGLCVNRHLNESLDEFHPDLVVYIAGTSVLCTDIAGCLCLSAQVRVSLCGHLLLYKQ